MKELTKLWAPSQTFKDESNLNEFMSWLSLEKDLMFPDYEELWRWSTEEIALFWSYISEFFEVQFYTKPTSILEGEEMPNFKWFEAATLNYAEHIFRNRKGDTDTALIFQNEHIRKEISWKEIEEKVKYLRAFLVSQGVKKGDRVVGYLPNIPEATISFLACCSLGAVWSCCSLDFGEKTVIDRFSQIAPKILIAADGYQYGGKKFSRKDSIEKIRNNIQTIETTILVNYLDENVELNNCVYWNDINEKPIQDSDLAFEPVPFDHPIWVLYSSGTTGKPKAITHSHGGVLLEHLKYLAFHNDLKSGELFFWFTTTGWMMWNYVQASMLLGGIPVLYDGSPAYPNFDVLWKMAEELNLPHFGTSAPFLTACMKKGMDINENFNLPSLKSISSTGAPLPPEVFEWIYEKIDKDIWLCSMSGGTDVCTAFVGGNPLYPVYKGAIQCRALGCALYAYDEAGKRIDEDGVLGEMVIEKPMPSMPIYFWNDPNDERYYSSYFSEIEGKWRHGDWVTVFNNGSLIIQGRSDAVLNRNGIRIGTAEIYNVLDEIEEIEDALIVNLEKEDGDDVLPLFVKIVSGKELSLDLGNRIKSLLKTECSPRHVPTMILSVPDIPYTLSGKKMEVPIKKLLMRMKNKSEMNIGAMRNPNSIDYFESLDFGF